MYSNFFFIDLQLVESFASIALIHFQKYTDYPGHMCINDLTLFFRLLLFACQYLPPGRDRVSGNISDNIEHGEVHGDHKSTDDNTHDHNNYRLDH